MKLHLQTSDTRQLAELLALVATLRKQIYMRFSSTVVSVLLVDESVGNEPQLWIKIQTRSVFDQIDIQCVRDAILVEINVELLLLALQNYERSSSRGLTIRLQKNTLGGASAASSNGRNANLCLSYANSDTDIVHSFRIPVKILRSSHHALILKEPEVSDINFMILLPPNFNHIFRRLDKFKELTGNDYITLRASRNKGGFLGLEFEREGQFRVTLSWNEPLQFLKPVDNAENTETTENTDINHGYLSLGYSLRKSELSFESVADESGITVRMLDWRIASKVASTCKRVILLVSQGACVFHCLLDDSDTVEVIYYIHGVNLLG